MITRDQSALLAPVERDLRLDLFRGIGLWMIFLDHIPHDVVAWLTLRNYGFSDAAEFFVFISGYLVGWIYGPIVAGGWFLAALKRLWRAAADVCRPHHAVPVVHGADRPHRAGNSTTRCTRTSSTFTIFSHHPDMLIGQALTLRYKPVNLDVLPLYITLVLAAPFMRLVPGAPAEPDARRLRGALCAVRACSTGTSPPIRPARPGISIRSAGS